MDNRFDGSPYHSVESFLPEHTGLPLKIWIVSQNGVDCPPVLMVSPKPGNQVPFENAVQVAFADEGIKEVVGNGQLSPKNLEAVRRFVLMNEAVLLDFWYGWADDLGFIERLKKV